MKQYVCSMWLAFAVVDTEHIPEAQDTFDKFWPGTVGHRWRNMLVEAADDRDFLDKVNTEFKTRAKDLKGCPKGLLSPFEFRAGGDWVFNPKLGVWEISTRVKFDDGGLDVWRFDIGGKRKASVYVYMSANALRAIGTRASNQALTKQSKGGKKK